MAESLYVPLKKEHYGMIGFLLDISDELPMTLFGDMEGVITGMKERNATVARKLEGPYSKLIISYY